MELRPKSLNSLGWRQQQFHILAPRRDPDTSNIDKSARPDRGAIFLSPHQYSEC